MSESETATEWAYVRSREQAAGAQANLENLLLARMGNPPPPGWGILSDHYNGAARIEAALEQAGIDHDWDTSLGIELREFPGGTLIISTATWEPA